MPVSITNNGSTLKIDNTSTLIYIPKPYYVQVDDQYVIIGNKDFGSVTYKWREISSPVSTSPQNLADKLTAFLNLSLPFGADSLVSSNADVNGNYQTHTYKVGGTSGTVVKVVNITYDASGNIINYSEA
jgi:hypothetical protein